MQYFNFEKHWEEFRKHLHSEEIVTMLRENNLTHPLWECAHGDGMHNLIHEMACDDIDKLQKSGKVFEDDDNEEFFEFFDFYFNRYAQPEYIHYYIPSGRCHDIASSLFKIAQLIFPNKKWILLQGTNHSTVYNEEENILFDLLMWFHNRRPGNSIDYSAKTLYENVLGKGKDSSTSNTEFMTTIYDPVNPSLYEKSIHFINISKKVHRNYAYLYLDFSFKNSGRPEITDSDSDEID